MPPRPRPATAGKAKRTAAATAPPRPVPAPTQPVVVKSEEQSPPSRSGLLKPDPAAHAVSSRTAAGSDSEPIDIDLLEVSVIVLFECAISKVFQTSEDAAADSNPPVQRFTAPSFLGPARPAAADTVAGHTNPPVNRFTTPSFLAKASPAAADTVAGHTDPLVKRFTTPSFLAQASPAVAAALGSVEPTVRSFYATLRISFAKYWSVLPVCHFRHGSRTLQRTMRIRLLLPIKRSGICWKLRWR